MNISAEITAAAGYGRKIGILSNGEPVNRETMQTLVAVSYDYDLLEKVLERDCASFSRGNGATVEVRFQAPSPYTFEAASDVLNAIFVRLDEVNQAFYDKYPAICDHANEDYRFVPRRTHRR